MSAICEIMNINVYFRTIVSASRSVFLKKYQNANKIKTKNFSENRGHPFVKNAMMLTCAKIQRKMLMFGEVGSPESYFWDQKPHGFRHLCFLNIK